MDWELLGKVEGPQGPIGETGSQGQPGVGVPLGGTVGQILAKLSNDDYDTGWINNEGGGGDSTFNNIYTVHFNSVLDANVKYTILPEPIYLPNDRCLLFYSMSEEATNSTYKIKANRISFVDFNETNNYVITENRLVNTSGGTGVYQQLLDKPGYDLDNSIYDFSTKLYNPKFMITQNVSNPIDIKILLIIY